MQESRREKMPDVLLADLFSGGLVVITENKTAATEQQQEFTATPVPVHQEERKPETPALPDENEPEKPLNRLGEFRQKVLVVVEDPHNLYLDEQDFDLLSNVLKAVKLSIADTAIVNLSGKSISYSTLQNQLPAKVALYFGVEPVSIGVPLKFPAFQVQKWNGTTFLYSPSLQEYQLKNQGAVSLKKQLWEALQKIFNF